MIVIVDYGVGNLNSVANMVRKAGGDVLVSNSCEDILRADKLLLPGVGHFDYGMKKLNSSGLRDAVDRFALDFSRPVLGICLGAQILGYGSEEGNMPGLGWVDMVCRKIPVTPGIRVPHMGWNQIKRKTSSKLLERIDENARFYFVHSYRMECTHAEDVLATAVHGTEFTCAVQRGNIMGTQFHPEKSLRHGLALMRSFVEI